MRAVNLLPNQTSGKSVGFDRALAIAAAVTVVVVVAVAGGFFLEKANAGTASREAVAAQAALDQALSQQPTTHSPAPAQLQIPVVLSQEQPWHLALDSALSTRVAWDVLLSQLEYVVPSTMTLTNVTLGSAPGAAGGTISLGGTAFSSKDIAVFLAALSRVPKVSQVALTSSAAEVGRNDVTFQISAVLTLPAAVTAPVDTSTTTGSQG